jgi:hypothetical protein
LEPQLTDLLLAVRVSVMAQGPSVPLWLDVPPPLGMSEAANSLVVRVTLRLAVYRQSLRLGDKPLETHDQ